MQISEKVAVAVLAAVATLGAAAIAILPELLNRNDSAGSISEELNEPATSTPAEPIVIDKPGGIKVEEGGALPPVQHNVSPPDRPVSQTINGDGNVQIGHGSDNNRVTVDR